MTSTVLITPLSLVMHLMAILFMGLTAMLIQAAQEVQ